jgi:hypothetical protein
MRDAKRILEMIFQPAGKRHIPTPRGDESST